MFDVIMFPFLYMTRYTTLCIYSSFPFPSLFQKSGNAKNPQAQ